MTPRGTPFVLAVLAVLWILALTLSPAGDGARLSLGACLVCGERGLANIISNLLLFFPLGAFLVLAGVAPLVVVMLAALLSGGIELTQHWVPGRNPNPGDTLFNTLGAAAGVVVARSSGWWWNASVRLRLRLGGGALAVALATVLAIGWLLGPGYPEGTYFGQWTPEQERFPAHPGRVLEARIGGVDIPSVRLEDAAGVRTSLRSGESVAVRAVVGPTVDGTWPIFRVAAGRGTLVVTLARQRDDLLVRFHTRAAALRLTPPEIRVGAAFAGVPGDEAVTIRVWRADQAYCVEVDRSRSCGQGFTAGRGWALLHGPWRVPPSVRPVLDAALIAVLLLPVGFWWRRGPLILVGAALAMAVLVLTPELTALRPSPPGEFVGGLVGLLGGAALGRVLVDGTAPRPVEVRS